MSTMQSGRAGFATLLSLAIFAAGAVHAQAQRVPVRFTTFPNTVISALLDVAVDRGLLAQVGIDAQTVSVTNGPAAVTALASGSVDVAINAPEVFLALADKGQSLKLIAGQTKSLAVFAARPGLALPASFPESVRALKGKKVGVTALSSATQYLTISLLNAAGLEAQDVSFVVVGTGGPQALAAGLIDVGVLTGAQVDLATALGARIIMDTRSANGCPPQVNLCGIAQVGVWVTGDWFAKNRETVQKIRRALSRADAYLHDPANADYARQFLGQHVPQTVDQAGRTSYIQTALLLSGAEFSRQDLARWIAIDHKGGAIGKAFAVEEVFGEGTPETPQAVRELAK